MKNIILAVLVVLTVAQAFMLSQAETTPRSATDVTNAEILTILKLAGLDEQIRVVDMGKYNVGIGILHRGATRPGAAGVSGFSHDQITEVYYILSGAGTLVTGGTMPNPRPRNLGVLAGPSLSGAFENGDTRQVGPGDVIIIPPGVPHGFSAIADHVDYLSVRVDADHVLPAGYVHPAVRPRAAQ